MTAASSRTTFFEALAQERSTASVLWRRDLVRFFREKTRIVGALLQPLIFWAVIGTGMSPAFRLPGASRIDYLQYFFPGVLVMVVLFTSIFATMSVIDDRHNGFLQGVLVAPGSRAAIVMGKSLGATTVALIQALAFVLLAPLAGFSFAAIDWPVLVVTLALISFGLSAAGFAVAWWLDSVQGYHVVMSLLLIPAWVVSGAIFPVRGASFVSTIARLNPLSYAVSLARRSLELAPANESVNLSLSSLTIELFVLVSFAVAAWALATFVCYRRR